MTSRPWFLACRIVPAALLVGLAATLLPLVLHHSENPRFLGRYSASYLAIVLIHLAALALAVVAWRERRRFDGLATDRAFPPVLLAWATFGALAVAAPAWIAMRTADGDFRHLAFLAFAAGSCAYFGLLLLHRALRRPFLRLSLLAASVFATLLVAELLLRLPVLPHAAREFRRQQTLFCESQLAVHRSADFHNSMFESDPELGFKYRPNLDVRVPSFDAEAASYTFRTDGMGFINDEAALESPVDVAIVGDSFVAESWPGILRGSTGLNVLNFGVPAYAPPQYTVVLRRFVLPLRPRLVLYCIYQNDVVESPAFDEWRASGLDWFAWKGGLWFGRPVVDRPGRLYATWQLLRISRIYGLAEYLRFARSDRGEAVAARPVVHETERHRMTFDIGAYQYQADVKSEFGRRGLEIVASSVDEAKTLCDAAGVELIVLLLPPKERVHLEALRDLVSDSEPTGNLAEFAAAIESICARSDIECRDLAPAFREAARRTGLAYYRDTDFHWNLDGSNLAAETVAALLAEKGLAAAAE